MSRRHTFPLISAALVLLLGSSAFAAQHADTTKGPGKGHTKAITARADTAPRSYTAHQRGRHGRDVYVFDRDGHRRVITDYYRREGLPPGLARRETLPPGLARQLRERGRLPPGLQRRLYPVPSPLVGRLPAVPSYYSRYFVGRDLVVVDRRTNRVVSVVRNVY
jgi:hypothetical protein